VLRPHNVRTVMFLSITAQIASSMPANLAVILLRMREDTTRCVPGVEGATPQEPDGVCGPYLDVVAAATVHAAVIVYSRHER